MLDLCEMFSTIILFIATAHIVLEVLLYLLLLLSRFSHVGLCATPQMAAHQLPHPWDSPGKNTGVGIIVPTPPKRKLRLKGVDLPKMTPEVVMVELRYTFRFMKFKLKFQNISPGILLLEVWQTISLKIPEAKLLCIWINSKAHYFNCIAELTRTRES